MKSIVLARSANEKSEHVFWRFFTFATGTGMQEGPTNKKKSRDLIGLGVS
jgi:hypothetical protein